MRKNFISLLLINLILGGFYLSTISPGLSWANDGTDSGDLITAAATHGVAHPGGYPTYLLLAKVFQLIPIGTLAFRTNLLSAVCILMATCVLYCIYQKMVEPSSTSFISGFVTSLLFGLSPMVWSQAIITEVHGLQALFVAILLFMLLQKEHGPYFDLLVGLIFGLATGNHLTVLLLLPLLFVFEGNHKTGGIKSIMIRLAGLTMGCSVYLFLPIWASNHPPVNWGNPVNMSAFWKVVTGEIYRSNFTSQFASVRILDWIGIFTKQIGLAGWFLVFFYLLRRWENRRWNLILFFIFFSYLLFAIFYGTGDSWYYLIPSLMVFVIWAGLGLEEITRTIAGVWKPAISVVPLLVLAVFAFQVYKTFPEVDASRDLRGETFGRSMMENLPENAIVLTSQDETTFTLWYFHFALHERPDIAILDDNLLIYNWYVQNLRYIYPDLVLPEVNKMTGFKLMMSNPSRITCRIQNPDISSMRCEKPVLY